MNKNEEYRKLMEELENTPVELEHTMSRIKVRSRIRYLKKFFVIPVSSCLTLLLAFTLLVNSVPVFAKTCGNIPVLKELAKLVAVSPSLSAAVENEYVQPIEQEQTLNDITARVEYVIVDQKQLNIFYSLDSEVYHEMQSSVEISELDGSNIDYCTMAYGKPGIKNGELDFISIDSTDRDVPNGICLTLKVYDNGSKEKAEPVPVEDSMFLKEPVSEEPEYISVFNFELQFNPYFTSQAEKIMLNKSFILDHQELILEGAEIYPTHMRLNFKDVVENTAWLKSLEFYIENEKGKRFDKIVNGITGTGKVDSPMIASHRLESSFFSKSKRLTMYITGVTWLDKDREKIKLDLKNVKAEGLPEGVTFEKAERKKNGWLLTFAGKTEKESHSYSIWNSNYYDEAGKEYYYHSWSTTFGYMDEEKDEFIDTPYVFWEEIPLKDYPYDTVYMLPAFTRKVALAQPVVIEIN